MKGVYRRDGKYYAGITIGGRWTFRALDATNLTEARKEREKLLLDHVEGRQVARDGATFADLFSEWQGARRLWNRTRNHEAHLLHRHLSTIEHRRIQDIDARDLARILRGMRDRYSPWTTVAVYRVIAGVFALALRRGVIVRSPVDGLAPSERPKQRNAREVAVLDAAALDRLIASGVTDRWRVALALAG
ncbi:MAG TPA: hypothetical protein VHI53_14250, partial [Gaiellaceae bacterium]|nr:hypothetical protein [Gaiellaceae bacterium]